MLSGDLGTAMRWLVEIGGAEYDTASLIRFSDPTVRLVKYYLSPGYLEWRRRSGAWTA